ncbi:HlyD family efflux transporter periplasmic adaptor subunit [Fulvivirga ulvae]|uniref:efflux RND transporter periplasmic adaptor subunit n=1 Tax=Fulvivirga ulvae TaxID=2904245 RepID=UPI001F3EA850|nr:HlyD family efflux transporter periplasmic adaptor subunit [Fulvivirga ulvae]UII30998.1 HlyD family efflux transporter periplasmic adaptor subunit [Fulvivirga ulvae]
MKLRQIVIIAIGLFILIGSFFLSGMLGGMKEPPKVEPPVEVKKYVRTEPVSYKPIQTEIVAFGRVRTAESLDMIAEVSGRMSAGAVPLKEGQRFKKGTLLYKIDDTETRLNLQSQKSTFLKDLAAILPDLKIDFSDNYSAWENYFGSINLNESLPELPDYKSNKEKTFLATRNIFSSYYSIKSAEANLRKHRFYAPFNGTISSVNLQSGSYVNPGNNIGKLLRSDKLELRVDVATSDIDWIDIGSPTRIISENGQEWTGTVTRIGEFVNQQTQSIDVFISVKSGENRMYDGEYLKTIIPGKVVENGMIIPRNAIFNGNEVFVLNDSTLNVKQIKIHKLNAETAIFSGLKEQSDLVVEPLINAHNNMRAFKLESERDIDLEKKKAQIANWLKIKLNGKRYTEFNRVFC